MSRRPAPGSVLLYDGDCGFCTRSLRAIATLGLAEPRIVAYQDADLDALGLTAEQCDRELQWVRPDGRADGGAQAVASLLRASGGLWTVLGALMRMPPLRWFAALVYRLVADNRQRLPGGTPACALPPAKRPGADTA